jgi:hypothetical protein
MKASSALSFAFSVFLGVTACGSSSPTATPTNSTATTTTPTSEIGAQGGTVAASNGSSVRIAAGALTSNVAITATPAPNALTPANATSVGTPITFGPEGQQFLNAATVTLVFDPTLLPSGASASDIVVFTAPAGSASYTPLATQVVNATHVSAATTHFSTFFPAVAKKAGANYPISIVATSGTGGSSVVVPFSSQQKGSFAITTTNTTAVSYSNVVLSAGLGTDPSNQWFPLTTTVCDTDSTGACVAGQGENALFMIGPGATSTFAIFVTASAPIAQSAGARIYVTAKDFSGSNTLGSTSIGVYTE